MPIDLRKGENASLTQQAPSMTKLLVGLGWDVRRKSGAPFDLDASAIVCDAEGKALADEFFVFYNNSKDPSGAVQHQGDNRNGEGEGDDESIIIDLTKLPREAALIAICVSIHDAEERRQTFGQVKNAFVRVLDADDASGEEKVRFDLEEDYSLERSMVFAEVYKKGQEWKFRAVGQGYYTGLAGVIYDYGLMEKSYED